MCLHSAPTPTPNSRWDTPATLANISRAHNQKHSGACFAWHSPPTPTPNSAWDTVNMVKMALGEPPGTEAAMRMPTAGGSGEQVKR